MAKFKSSAAYRAADTLNKQITNIAKQFGADSEIYQQYVNKLTAALPESATHVSKRTGLLQVSKGKNAGVTAQKIKEAAKGLPSVRQVKSDVKRSIASERLAQRGLEDPSYSTIYRETQKVTEQDVQRYIDAKSFVKQHYDGSGRIKYNAEVAELMQMKGPKSYEDLMAVLQLSEEVEENAEAQAKEAVANVESSYERGRANINN